MRPTWIVYYPAEEGLERRDMPLVYRHGLRSMRERAATVVHVLPSRRRAKATAATMNVAAIKWGKKAMP